MATDKLVEIDHVTDYISRDETMLAFCHASQPVIELGKPSFIVDYVKTLKSIPAADVVEVVRCKDCRYYTAKHGRMPWNTTKLYCNRSATVATAPEDFCSFGEKTADKQCLPLRREEGGGGDDR